MARRYKIYAGMTGGFDSVQYQCTIEAHDEDDALEYARQLAQEEYQSYEGYHGILDWHQCREDLYESGWITDKMTEQQIDEATDEHYLNEMESWIEYYVEEAIGEDEEEEE